MVTGTDRVLADLKMNTDLSTHYLRGMIVWRKIFNFELNEEKKKEMRKKKVLKIFLRNYQPS